MALSKEHNPAAIDPAVLYWDWEKAKIVNCPPGLSVPQVSAYNPKSMLPERSRSGTLKRYNAFSEDRTNAFEDDRNELDRDNSDTGPKCGFPESLYSEAKRKKFEDMGRRFMDAVQKLDSNDLNSPVDFNPILERHWTKLQEFYSEQVATVHQLERELKAAPGLTGSPIPASPPNLPLYVVSQLSESKKYYPSVPTKLEKKSPPYPGSEKQDLSASEAHKSTESLRSLDRPSRGEFIDGAVDASQPNHETYYDGSLVMDNFSRERAHDTVHNWERDQLAVTGTTLINVHGDPQTGPKYPEEVELATIPQVGLGLYTSGEVAIEGDSAKKFEETVLGTTYNFSNCQGVVRNENSHSIDGDSTEAHDPRGFEGVSYPMNIYLIKNYKTLAEAMRLAVMTLEDVGEIYTETDPSFHSGEDITEVENHPDQVFFPQSIHPLPEFVGPFRVSSIQAENHRLIEDTLDCDYAEDIYSSDQANSSSFEDSSGIIETSELLEVESLVGTLSDTVVGFSEEISIGAGTGLQSISYSVLPQKQVKVTVKNNLEDSITSESLPHDTNSDSFSVSDDSSLNCSFTKAELEKLQLEVKESLEQAQKNGTLLIPQWTDRFDNKAGVDSLSENIEGVNYSRHEASKGKAKETVCDGDYSHGSDDGDAGDRHEIIKIFEFEYIGTSEDCEGEDDEIDLEMEKILAWIELEDAKIEDALQSTQATIDCNKGRIEEAMVTDNDDDGKEKKSTKERIIMGIRKVAEKKLSVVVEEDDEDCSDNEDTSGEGGEDYGAEKEWGQPGKDGDQENSEDGGGIGTSIAKMRKDDQGSEADFMNNETRVGSEVVIELKEDSKEAKFTDGGTEAGELTAGPQKAGVESTTGIEENLRQKLKRMAFEVKATA